MMVLISTLLSSFLLMTATLLPIINPLAATPIFWSMTSGATKDTRRMLSRKIAINIFLILVASTLIGNLVLSLFGISLPIVQIGGGLLVVQSGWKLLSAEDSDSTHHENMMQDYSPEKAKTSAFYPLTFPLTCGPGGISAAITVGATLPSTHLPLQVFALLGMILGCLLIGLSIYLSNRYAATLFYRMGPTFNVVLMRLMAFILVCIGIQITWSGTYELLLTIPGLKN